MKLTYHLIALCCISIVIHVHSLYTRTQAISCVPNTPNEPQCNERGACDSSGTGCVCYNPYNYWASEYCSTYHIGPELEEGQICSPNERNIYCHDVGVCNSDGTSCICDDYPYRIPDDNCETYDVSRGHPTISPIPTLRPTRKPTRSPTNLPTVTPSGAPTLHPTLEPTPTPTSSPSYRPTTTPTISPTPLPSLHPTTPPPTTHPTVSPTKKPTRSPTAFPTKLPTSAPTTLPTYAVVTAYEAYNSNADLGNALQTISHGDNEPTMSYAVNSLEDTSRVDESFAEFISGNLVTPFELEYYQASVVFSGVSHSNSTRFSYNYTCTNLTVTSMLVDVLAGNSIQRSRSFSCGGVEWTASSGFLCIGCDKLSSVLSATSKICSRPEMGIVALYTGGSCIVGTSSTLSKYFMVMSFSSRELVAQNSPTIESLSVVAARTNALVEINVSTTPIGGQVYCNAFTEEEVAVTTITRSALKAEGYSVIVPPGSAHEFVRVVVNITNLVASTGYSVYCYIEDSSGIGITQQEVLITQTINRTLCCREISYISAPTFVKYGVYGASNSKYIFQFDIQAFPEEDSAITVTPLFLEESGAVVGNITSTPSGFDFSITNRNNGLLRSFIVNPMNPHRIYFVVLNITGPGATKYKSPPPHKLQVIGEFDSLPPPDFRSAVFSKSGQSVTVCFDSSTDYAKTVLGSSSNTEWECREVFSFIGVQYASCTWLSDRCVTITFCGSGLCTGVKDRQMLSMLEPEDVITLRSNTIKASCSGVTSCTRNIYSSTQSIAVDFPETILQPIVYLSSSQPGGECQTDLVLDASASTGNGGRAWKAIEWKVSAADKSDVSNIVKVLNKTTVTSAPTEVPFSLLSVTTYTITLTLSNFMRNGTLGVASRSVTVNVLSSSLYSRPSVSIDGSTLRRINRFDPFSAQAVAKLPKCSASNRTRFSWKIYKGTVLQSHIKSVSPDPSKFKLNPYTLDAGAEYRIYVYATLENGASNVASLSLTVDVGSVYVSIRGASTLLISPTSTLELDASNSVQEDVAPWESTSNSLMLSWSCAVTGMLKAVDGMNFGQSCDSLLSVSQPSYVPVESTVPINVEGMIGGVEYTFTAAAFAADGGFQYDTTTVQVADIEGDIAHPTISTSIKKFSSSSILQILGQISRTAGSTSSVLATWELYDDSGNPLPLQSYVRTPVSKIFANASQSYPLSCVPNSFVSGSSYTFRLSTAILYSDMSTSDVLYSELTVTANGPPSSGELRISPTEGIGMETLYFFDAPYWIDDIDDYPLYYTFYYKLVATKSGNNTIAPAMTLALASQKSNIHTIMPSGLRSQNYTIICSVRVTDAYGAAEDSSTTIISYDGETSAYVSSLESFVNAAVLSGDLIAIVQTVNTGALALSAVDCSDAPDCTALHRFPCDSVANTCGVCVDGYSGVYGSSNTACVEETELNVHSSMGSLCDTDMDCAPLVCLFGTCSQPEKSCPTDVANTICSGHGVCSFVATSSLAKRDTCIVDDSSCVARCSCSADFYGAGCGLTLAEYANRSNTRTLMCQSLEYLITNTDPSDELMAALSSTLSTAFDPTDVVTTDVLVSCLSVLRLLKNITDMGYLSNEGLLNELYTSPHASLGNVLSSFTSALSLMLEDGAIGDDDTKLSLVEMIEYEISETADSIISSVSSSMVGGESTYEIVSSGVKMSVSYGDAEDLSNGLLTPPASDVSDNLPAILLPASGLKACGASASDGQYVRLSMLEWSNNPYISTINSTSLRTLSSRVLRFTSVSVGETIDEPTIDEEYNTTYELVMQYNSPQNWSKADPSCTTFTEGSLSSCPCEVLSYTEYEVKFECSNLIDLCPPTSSRRRLQALNDMNTDHPHYYHYDVLRRRLDFEYEEGDDDGEGASSNLLEYGAMVNSIGTELTTTLLNNPADIITNMQAMIPLLTVLSVMFFIMIITIIWLSYWDEYDANYIRYVQKAYGADKVSRKSDVIEINAPRKLDLSSAFMTPRYWKIFGVQKRGTKQRPVKVATMESITRSRIMSETDVSKFSRGVDHSVGQNTSTPPCGQSRDSANDELSEKSLYSECTTSVSNSSQRSPSLRSGNAERFFTKHIDSFDSDDNTNDIHVISVESSSRESPKVNFEEIESSTKYGKKSIIPNSQSKLPKIAEDVRRPRPGLFMYLTEKVGQYFDEALPPSSLLAEKDPLSRFFTAVVREHDWIRIFTYPSLRLSRVHRYFIVCTYVLIILFVDALFFGILFPDDQSCEEYNNTSVEECESDPSPYSSALKKCVWDSDEETCTLRPPPSSVQFYMVVAVSVSLLSVLPQVIVAHIIEDYASQKPRWGAASTQKSSIQQYRELSELHKSISHMLGDYKHSEFKRHMELHTYYDHLSVEEEANILLADVDAFLNKATASTSYPWRVSELSDDRKANLDAIQRALGVYVDGTPEPLSLKQRVLFHTARERIEWKLSRVRDQVQDIQADMETFIEGEEGCRDTALIQHFILEQISPMKRFLLRKQFFQFDNANPAEVDGTTWLMCWALIISIWLFCMYWILQWAAMHSRVTMVAWGAQVVIAVIQDVFINEVILVMVTHVFVIENLRPQLKKIYHTLNYIMNVKVCNGDDNEVYDDVRVVQHLSASCRAARTEKLKHLPASQLLMRLDDKDVALCRGNRDNKMGKLTLLCIAIPVAIALSHEMVQECLLDVIIPTAWCCFIIANGYLYEVSPYLLALPYVLLCLGMLYRYGYLLPKRKMEAKLATCSPVPQRTTPTSSFRMSRSTSTSKKCNGDRNVSLREEHDKVWKNMNLSMGLTAQTFDFSVHSEATDPMGKNKSKPFIPRDITRLKVKSNVKDFVFADSTDEPVTKLMNKIVWRAPTHMYVSSKRLVQSGRSLIHDRELTSTSEEESIKYDCEVSMGSSDSKPLSYSEKSETASESHCSEVKDVLGALPMGPSVTDGSHNQWDEVSTDFSELTMSEMFLDDRSTATGTTQGGYEELKISP